MTVLLILMVPGLLAAAARADPTVPATACYSIVLAGTVNGLSFDTTSEGRNDVLCVGAPVSDATTPNGANPLESCLLAGHYASGELGSIQLGTNAACWSAFSTVDVAYVSVDRVAGTLVATMDPSRFDVAGNAFGLFSLVDLYARVAQGTITLQFGDGCQLVRGTVDVSGPSLIYGVTKRFTATIAAQQPNPAPTNLSCKPATSGGGGSTGGGGGGSTGGGGGSTGGGTSGTAPGGDSGAPYVIAVGARGRRGRVIRLRYVTTDDSGQTRDRIRIARNGRLIRTINIGMGHDGPWSVKWRIPSRISGPLRYCVRSWDAAGNASNVDCAAITLRR